MADRYDDLAKRLLAIIGTGSNDWFSTVDRVATALRDQDTWYAIDDPEHPAPKDGTRVLTFGCLHDDGGVDMGELPRHRITQWLPRNACWYSADSGAHEPTH